jgi:hypothetical protein
MRAMFRVVVLGALIATVAQAAGPKIREVPVQFPKGETGVSLKGKLKGDETVDYNVRVAAGQSMAIVFKPGNPSAYFNVLPPGSDSAIFIGSTSGNRYEGALPADGTYTIRVYLMRSAPRRNESASYALDVGVSGGAKRAEVGPTGG